MSFTFLCKKVIEVATFLGCYIQNQVANMNNWIKYRCEAFPWSADTFSLSAGWVGWDKAISQRSRSKTMLCLQSALQVSLPLFLKRVWSASGLPKFYTLLLIFWSQTWGFHRWGLRERQMLLRRPSLPLCHSVQSSLHHAFADNQGGFLINTRLTGGTLTQGNLAFQSLLSAQPWSQSTGFKGNATLGYLLTANGGGAGLYSTQTMKSNINLVQTPCNFRLAWEQVSKRYGY